MIHTIKKLISSLFIQTQIISPFTKDLDGKVVIITGGSGKIGTSIGKALVREGATVVNISRTVRSNLVYTESISADITNKKQIEQAIKQIVNTYGKIDVLINNAGIFLDKKIESITEKECADIVDVNIYGPINMATLVVPHMKKQKSGTIINIGSKISHNSNVAPHKVLYAMSKYALEGFSLALSKELHGTGIRSSCLMIGTANTFVSIKSKDYMSPENVGFIISMIIKCEDLDFESILIKSTRQKI